MKKAFTLLEILIVVSLLVILAVGLIIVFNPKTQIDKANDGKRKAELTSLNKLLEDWYNDHSCYPKPDEICYNAVLGETSCNICGNKPTSPNFSPYLESLPCDPQQSDSRDFFYEVNDVDCPSLYRIYTKLSNTNDPAITQLGCQNGCGPYGNCNYNYGVTSPNASVIYCIAGPTAIPTPTSSFLPTPTSTPVPTATPTPTSAPTPTPEGNYYCQSFGNCAFYNNQVWTCNPSYADSQCTGSNNCNITGSCQRK